MIDPEILAHWNYAVRRDDWHLILVGSDVRQMLAEIDELRAEIERLLNERENLKAALTQDQQRRFYYENAIALLKRWQAAWRPWWDRRSSWRH